MAYDLIRNNEQVYHLLNYGIEGVQYVIKDGKRARPEGYDDVRDNFYPISGAAGSTSLKFRAKRLGIRSKRRCTPNTTRSKSLTFTGNSCSTRRPWKRS